MIVIRFHRLPPPSRETAVAGRAIALRRGGDFLVAGGQIAITLNGAEKLARAGVPEFVERAARAAQRRAGLAADVSLRDRIRRLHELGEPLT